MIIEIKNVETQVKNSDSTTSDCLANFEINDELDLKTLSITPANAYWSDELYKIVCILDLVFLSEVPVIDEDTNTAFYYFD